MNIFSIRKKIIKNNLATPIFHKLFIFVFIVLNVLRSFSLESKIQNPLKQSLVRISSSYFNQCVNKSEMCNKYVKRSGLGFIFKVVMDKPHFFVATTSHLTQGKDLSIRSLNRKIKYEPKVYKIKNKNEYLRTINNDEDLEIIEINDPKLEVYFEHYPNVQNESTKSNEKLLTPSQLSNDITGETSSVSTSSSRICTKVDKFIALNHGEVSTSLTSEFIGLNVDEAFHSMRPLLPFILNGKNSIRDIEAWKSPLDKVQRAILNTTSVYYIFDLEKSNNQSIGEKKVAHPGDYALEFARTYTDGFHQVDSSTIFNRIPEYTWDMNELLLKHFIFRGQSGTPYFYQLNEKTLCFVGLIKGFHRYFRIGYTNDLDGSNLISVTVEKLKSLSEPNLLVKDKIKMTEVLGISSWFMKDNETFRKFKLPFSAKEISELASWYGPSGGGEVVDGGGGDSSDGGGSDTSDGGGSQRSNGDTGTHDLHASRPLSEILSSSNNPGVNVGEEILLGIDLISNSKERHLYANMSSLKFLNTLSSSTKLNYIKLPEFEKYDFVTQRISKRLSNLNKLSEQLKAYQSAYITQGALDKMWEAYGLYSIYTKMYAMVSHFSADKRESVKQYAESFEVIYQLIDKMRIRIVKLLNSESAELAPPYCQLKLKSDAVQLKIFKGLGLKVSAKTLSDLTSNDYLTNFLTINLNSKFQVLSVQSNDEIYESITPDYSPGLDLRPKFFIKKGDERIYENTLILDLKGLLFFDLSRAKIHLTVGNELIEIYNSIKESLPLIIDEVFEKVIEPKDKLIQYSPEASVLSRVTHITYKPIGDIREYMIPCYEKKD